ncbi:DMT family transporter [[Clostridium] hylemonae]|nr:DMT family transporter [[Clostridium] hylemonae]MCB7520263.1 DMT family transporter [[Clostridium] hylemonae]QEK18807.1 hypothetical protein LAJLEIBI_02829 [[Clostridium] hylemonae DSM 15053]BDF05812.1 EamA family transporter [[Clostridium] hylemonae]
MKENKSVYIMFIFLQSVLYGIGNPVTKIAFESISVYWCLALRFSLAFFVLMLFFGKKIIRELKSARIMDCLPASLCMAAAYISVNLALKWTTATNVGFLMSLPVVLAPVLARVVLKTKYEWKHIPVQAAVVAGLYLLCCGEEGFVFGKGEAFALITAAAVAGALVYGEKSLAGMSACTVSAAQAGLTAVISLALAAGLEELHVDSVTPAAWGVVAYLAIGCTCIAYLLQNTAVAKISSQTVSMLQTSQPVATAVFSFLILGELLTVRGYIGAAVILVCILAESVFARQGRRSV